MINTWYFWVIIYLIASILFAHTFKKANRNMKDATKLTILLEVLTAFFAISLPIEKIEVQTINFNSSINEFNKFFPFLLLLILFNRKT